MRDALGRYAPRHRYRLVFDDGHNEDVSADTPSQAVARRKGGKYSLLPHTVTDLDSIEQMRTRVAVLHMPLLEAVNAVRAQRAALAPATRQTFTDYGEYWDD